MRGTFLCCAWACCAAITFGERKKALISAVDFSPQFGYCIPISPLATHEGIDELLGYTDRGSCVEPLAWRILFGTKQSLELGLQILDANNGSKEKLYAFYNRDVGVKFDIEEYQGSEFQKDNHIKLFMSYGYCISKKRHSWQMRLGFGFTAFPTTHDSIFAKEKNTNRQFSISYQARHTNAAYATGSLGMRYHFHLWKKIYVSAQSQLTTFKPNITYSRRIQDLFSQETSEEDLFSYRRRVWNICFAAGIGIRIQKKK